MSIATNTLNELEEVFSKISLEIAFIRAGSDEGMIPVYALLSEMLLAATEEEALLIEAVKQVQTKLDSLLDKAVPFDEHSITLIREFASWAQQYFSDLHEGNNPKNSFTSTTETAKPVTQNENTTQGPEASPSVDQLMVINLQQDKEILEEFYTEAIEHLENIEAGLLTLEGNPQDADSLNSLFRSFHTIKGVSGFLHLTPIQSLTHEVESLLDLARNNKITLTSSTITLILHSKDATQALVGQVAEALQKGTVPSEIIPVSHLIEQTKSAATGSPPPATDIAPRPNVEVDKATTTQNSTTNASSIRVNTSKLDNLLDSVGELVIVQSQIQESAHAAASDNSPLASNLSQLNRITKELQHTSMALRMVPIKPTFQKIGRLVRDLSNSLGKKVNFTSEGEDTELDRNVVEKIGDPLVHMVRNAIDHGLEDADGRKAAGKDETGSCTLRAYHQGSSIVIEIQDDGKGIDPKKILQKAIEKGIASPDQQYTKEEVCRFIFAPGFSTAAAVTDVSGRGVGMDVVIKNIEKLRGSVDIESEVGKGSTFKIKIPLTMAIIDGLVIQVGNDKFIVPTTSVQISLKPSMDNISTVQGKTEILTLRGNNIPILRLYERFGIASEATNLEDGIVVIMESSGRSFGLFVDKLLSKQEVVIKSLGSVMQSIEGIAGGAILGDGNIALILDPSSLLSHT